MLQEEKDKIINAAWGGDVQTLHDFASSGVDVTGIIDDWVSMYVCV